MRRRPLLLAGVAGLIASGLAGCSAEDEEPGVDLAALSPATGKADDAGPETRPGPGGLLLGGAAARELDDVLGVAGFDEHDEAGVRFRYGEHLACASTVDDAVCLVASRRVTDLADDADERYLATVHGRRFRSGASELLGALATAKGVSPGAVLALEHGRFECAKTAATVWCGVVRTTELELGFERLKALGPDHVYEGWIVTADGAVSSGRFDAPADGAPVVGSIPAHLAAAAERFVLTIEPRTGDAPEASATHLVAGDFVDGRAGLGVEHTSALGTTFATAAGGYILATPSTDAIMEDYRQGVWYVDPAAPGPSLTLPTLPSGWAYEGWIASDAGPITTGRFTTVAGADSDGAGPTAGPDPGPPFPGQDFIDPPRDLTMYRIAITVEPEPDDSPAPYGLRPLLDATVEDVPPPTLQAMTNTAADTNPSGHAVLR